MQDKIEQLEKEVEIIKQRNLRVEADKAWETSAFRIFSLCLITYIIAAIVMYFISVQNFLLNAFIPTIGYYLSTQSLPVIKTWWINKFHPK